MRRQDAPTGAGPHRPYRLGATLRAAALVAPTRLRGGSPPGVLGRRGHRDGRRSQDRDLGHRARAPGSHRPRPDPRHRTEPSGAGARAHVRPSRLEGPSRRRRAGGIPCGNPFPRTSRTSAPRSPSGCGTSSTRRRAHRSHRGCRVHRPQRLGAGFGASASCRSRARRGSRRTTTSSTTHSGRTATRCSSCTGTDVEGHRGALGRILGRGARQGERPVAGF